MHRRFWFLAREMLVVGKTEEARRCALMSLRRRPWSAVYAIGALALRLSPGAIRWLVRIRVRSR